LTARKPTPGSPQSRQHERRKSGQETASCCCDGREKEVAMPVPGPRLVH
jgi:hypothetical protein